MPKTKTIDLTPICQFDEKLKNRTMTLRSWNVGAQETFLDTLEEMKAKQGQYPKYYANILSISLTVAEAPFDRTVEGIRKLDPEVFEFILKAVMEFLAPPLAQKSNTSSSEPIPTDGPAITSS